MFRVPACGFLFLALLPASHATAADRSALLPESIAPVARRLIDTGMCPCGCGSRLPGSSQGRACFGCSVGKAEVSRILEGLAAGDTRGEVLLRLREPVLINVFADYTDPRLRETWRRVTAAAAATGLHRVVLRTPARTEPARRAVALAEFARERGRFFAIQRALIAFDGPWDAKSLAALAGEVGLSKRDAGRHIERADVRAQITKDRQHAERDGIDRFPAVQINRHAVPDTEEAIRRALRRMLLEESL